MNFHYVVTDRLSLRLLTPEVYDFVFEQYSEDQLLKFFGTQESYQKEKGRYEKGVSTFNRSFAIFQLIEKAGDQIIGWCGYHTWAIDHFRAEIGYSMAGEKLMNKGFMSEAMAAVLHYGFTAIRLHRIEALVAEYNIPSVALLRKNNFVREGVLREHYLVDGVFEDSVMYSLLFSEYKP